MKKSALFKQWQEEEKLAHIHGWDFSHIQDRYSEENDLPWDYRQVIKDVLTPDMKLLDIDTGGGEFLLSLKHDPANTGAVEGYPPNVELCKQVLLPLGIDFRMADGKDQLPFDDESFDLVINRHGDFNASEIARVLKKGGLFITEQVGAYNDRELVDLLLGKRELPFPNQTLACVSHQLIETGLQLVDGQECFRPICFFDVGALVWFSRIIEWEFEGFSTTRCAKQLFAAQELLEKQGCIEGQIHRFLIKAVK